VAIIYFIIALVLVPILYLASRSGRGEPLPGVLLVLGPFLYGVLSYVFTAIGCWLYNIVAAWVGGVALTLEPDGAGDASAAASRA
jgi:hypothetical protein